MRHKNAVKRLLVKAAQSVDRDDIRLSCLAISGANAGVRDLVYSDAIIHYERMFSPYHCVPGKPASYWDQRATPQRQQLRVLALLFAAASYEESAA